MPPYENKEANLCRFAPPRRPSCQAFTLVEIIVVVAIVLVLVGLLVSGVGRSVDRAKEAQSIGNLRSIGVAISAYLSENDNRYPYNSKPDAGKPRWTQLVEDYLPEKLATYPKSSGETFTIRAALSCPMLKTDKHHDISDYGVNNQVILREAVGNNQLAAASIPRPSQTVMAMAAQQSASDGVRGTWYVNTTGVISGNATTFIPSDRGTGKILCVFVDGHTEAISKEIFEQNKKPLLLPNP